jgi:hypothetical protein
MQEGSGRAKRKQLGLTLREAAAAGLIKNARGTKGNSQRRRSRAPRGGGPHTSTYAEQALRVREAAMIGGVFSALKPECRLLLLAAAELCGSLYATAAARMVPFLAQRAEVSRQLEDAAAAVADCNADNEELRQELASQTQECRGTRKRLVSESNKRVRAEATGMCTHTHAPSHTHTPSCAHTPLQLTLLSVLLD